MSKILEGKFDDLLELIDEFNQNGGCEDIRKRVDELYLNEVGFILDKEKDCGMLIILTDARGRVYEAYEVSEKYVDKAKKVINMAYDYYSNQINFFEWYTKLTSSDFIKMYTNLRNIPIIRHISNDEIEQEEIY